MVKAIGMVRKVGLGAVAGGLALGAGVASAADFDVTAEVQNTLAVTVVTPMNLGTLFVNDLSTGTGIGTLVLAPGGGMTEGETGQVIKSLGGHTPARASVATDQPFTVKVPAATFTASSWATADNVTGITDVVEMRLGGAGGNPSVARLYLANFTVGDITGGTETTAPAATAGDPVDITPDFGVADVSFGIGAEVFTDDSGTRTQYQAGTYEGTFAVTAEF